MKFSSVFSYRIVLAAFMVGVGCTPRGSSNGRLPDSTPPGAAVSGETLTVFMTGNVLSTLQPCGCSSGQLGGLDRRGAVLATAPADQRLVLDTGNLLAGHKPQDMIKLGVLFQAMSMLEYDLVHLTPEDLAAVTNLGLAQGGTFPLITPDGEASCSKKFTVAGQPLTVTVASARADSLDIDSLESLFEQRQALGLNILIIDDASDDVVAKLATLRALDVVICPTAADEPRIIDKGRQKPLLVSVGRLGKYVARLTARPAGDGTLGLDFDKVAVDESLAQDEHLAQLYKDYQVMVKEERLLEGHPRVPLPDGLKYLGNESCRSCHSYEYDKWSKNPHAHAYETLVNVGAQYDPECVKCHVVGFGYESGFISEESPKDLRDVGCEVCHGPGSEHLKSLTTGRGGTGISEPMAKCIDCHNPDHSPGYQGHEEEYLRKIIHWREPEAAGDVK
ncbi:MAG: hypothetical protein IH624_04450 [Phycisphaerae bacterium]|nr:hypothetical protein [Phycisphaerae bacterium]